MGRTTAGEPKQFRLRFSQSFNYTKRLLNEKTGCNLTVTLISPRSSLNAPVDFAPKINDIKDVKSFLNGTIC